MDSLAVALLGADATEARAASMLLRASFVFLSLFSLSGCGLDSQQPRWYSDQQVTQGKELFQKHCASCHGFNAQGMYADWKSRLSDGYLPPPPLNGTAHAWHHRLPLLQEIVRKGGALYDGKMPGFAGVLSEDEIFSVIAYFQSFWDEETYGMWSEMQKTGGNGFGAKSGG